jgi:manganese/zinc/iron transport system permease protein
MMALSAAIGAASGIAGALASATVPRLPTGPAIVLAASAVLVVSLLFAPRRGMVWAKLRERRVAARIRRENLLKDLYRLGESAGGWGGFAPAPLLMGVRGQTALELSRSARPLVQRGLLERAGDALRLTAHGSDEAARVVRKHRLWEVYLTRRLELARDHVHRDAEAMEHALTDAAVADLERQLGYPTVDPHGRPIPPPPAGRTATAAGGEART